MITVGQLMDIHTLHKQGLSIREIARQTDLSRNTVRKVLRGQHDLVRKPSDRSSKLDPYKDYLRRRRAELPLSAVRLLDEIRPMGYTGSVITLRRFLAQLEGKAQRLEKVTVRFETPPGHQAQADWTDAGKIALADGKSANLYAFTVVLSFSRMLFVRFTTSMTLPVLIECHRQAFDFFGGWPHVILYDNMKQVRTAPGKFNESFLDFAKHYGFEPRTCRPYRARTKGKVERAIDYVKDNFLLGLSYAGLDELNALARHWLEQTANVRLHATTQRRPIDLWPQEKLTPTASVPPYDAVMPVRRTVSNESMVHFGGSRYSVPPEHAGTMVLVSATGGQVAIRQGDVVIAEHRQAAQPGQSIVARDHLAELWRITHQQTAAPPVGAGRASCETDPEVVRVDLRQFEEVLS
jgi:transposase